MDVKCRMLGKKINELIILNSLYFIFMLLYISSQAFINKTFSDVIFIVLLTSGTIFINYRQKILYEKITENKETVNLYIQNGYNSYKEDLDKIFNNGIIDVIAVLYGLVFGLVVSFILTSEENIILKITYFLFLASANIPTFLAIYRLLSLVKYFANVISIVKFDYFALENYGETFIINIRNFVLFTAVTYTTVCLTSVIFTKINLGIIYILYTGFAIILIIIALAYSNYHIYKKKNQEIDRVANILNSKINNEIKIACNENDYYNISKIEAYIKYRDIIKDKNIDFTKIWTAIKLIGMAILPVLVQWALKIL